MSLQAIIMQLHLTLTIPPSLSVSLPTTFRKQFHSSRYLLFNLIHTIKLHESESKLISSKKNNSPCFVSTEAPGGLIPHWLVQSHDPTRANWSLPPVLQTGRRKSSAYHTPGSECQTGFLQTAAHWMKWGRRSPRLVVWLVQRRGVWLQNSCCGHKPATKWWTPDMTVLWTLAQCMPGPGYFGWYRSCWIYGARKKYLRVRGCGTLIHSNSYGQEGLLALILRWCHKSNNYGDLLLFCLYYFGLVSLGCCTQNTSPHK